MFWITTQDGVLLNLEQAAEIRIVESRDSDNPQYRVSAIMAPYPDASIPIAHCLSRAGRLTLQRGLTVLLSPSGAHFDLRSRKKPQTGQAGLAGLEQNRTHPHAVVLGAPEVVASSQVLGHTPQGATISHSPVLAEMQRRALENPTGDDS
jgi:hypothetical protein